MLRTSDGAARMPWRRIPPQLRTAAALITVWGALIIATTTAHPDFLSHSTLLAIGFNMVVPGVVALGLSLVTVSGALLDLSVGVTVAASAIMVATVLRAGYPTGLAVAAGLTTGVLIGLVNVILVVGIGINPIVATLATAFAGGGLLTVTVTGVQETVPTASGLNSFGQQKLFGIPEVLVVVLLLIALVESLIVRTRPGRHLIAVGGNPVAARARGISLRRVRVFALLASAMFAALGGVFLASQTTILSSAPDAQLSYRVAAIVLLGGISLSGGRGRVTGLFASLLLLSTLPTAIVSFGVSSSWQAILEGAALFLAVCLDARRVRKAR